MFYPKVLVFLKVKCNLRAAHVLEKKILTIKSHNAKRKLRSETLFRLIKPLVKKKTDQFQHMPLAIKNLLRNDLK